MQDFYDRYNVIFWDFDGVIKESNQVKANAFINLFETSDIKIKDKIRQYHKANEGISRYEKIPLFLNWAGFDASEEDVKIYCDLFSNMVFEGVVNSPWVPGVLNKLANKKNNQNFVLVSATPEKELCTILNDIKIYEIFDEVFGSPTLKEDAIKSFLKSQNWDSCNAVMIGDSSADYEASLANGIDFVLRCHEGNGALQNRFNGIKIKDFLV